MKFAFQLSLSSSLLSKIFNTILKKAGPPLDESQIYCSALCEYLWVWYHAGYVCSEGVLTLTFPYYQNSWTTTARINNKRNECKYLFGLENLQVRFRIQFLFKLHSNKRIVQWTTELQVNASVRQNMQIMRWETNLLWLVYTLFRVKLGSTHAPQPPPRPMTPEQKHTAFLSASRNQWLRGRASSLSAQQVNRTLRTRC